MSQKRIIAQVDLSAITHNVKVLHDVMPNPKPIMAVIKADGYGHGALTIARSLQNEDYIYGFATATSEEAFELREEGVTKPILVLGYVFVEDYAKMINEDIRFTVFTMQMAKQLSDMALILGKKALVHVKLDTGMSRIGIIPDDKGLNLVREMSLLEGLDFEGIFTHFAKCDEKDKSYTKIQYDKFNGFINELNKDGINFRITHCANSAGILEYPDAHFDLVRAGVVLYGLWPSDEVERKGVDLKPAMSLKSHIVFVKDIPEGTSISYGGTYVSKKPMRIATVPVGYADGYPRSLSSKGYVLIRGKRAAILGRICMDQMMVDVTDIPDAQTLDEVVLLGRQNDDCIYAEELGDMSGRFNYEFVCDIAPRVPRVYIKDGKFVTS